MIFDQSKFDMSETIELLEKSIGYRKSDSADVLKLSTDFALCLFD